jgi:hypothetical protein
MQGYRGLDDAALAEVDVWSRLAPGLCMIWVAVGTWRASPVILWSLMPIAALGALLPHHPFDLPYNIGLRPLTGGHALPPHGLPRRFACAIATIWIGAIGWAFQAGAFTAGYVLGGAMVLAAASPALIGFCIPSFFYGLVAGSPGSASRNRRDAGIAQSKGDRP